MLTPREASPLPEKFSSEEDQTHNPRAASSKTASPTHYQLAVPAPMLTIHVSLALSFCKDCVLQNCCVSNHVFKYHNCSFLSSDSSKLPPAPRKLRARAISPHVIKLKWRDPAKRRGRATRFYSVRYNAVGDDDSLFIQSADNRVRVGKLHPNTTYVFSVRTIAGKKGSPWSSKVKVTTAVVGELHQSVYGTVERKKKQQQKTPRSPLCFTRQTFPQNVFRVLLDD